MLSARNIDVYARNSAGRHEVKSMRWGLIPTQFAAAPELFEGSTAFARLETVHEKPYFADCWRKKWRCLMPQMSFQQKVTTGADLFGDRKRKTRVEISRADGQALAIAGIYNAFKTPEGLLLSAALLTREPGPLMSQIHDREPVVIDPKDGMAWLDGADDLALLTPWPDDAFTNKAA